MAGPARGPTPLGRSLRHVELVAQPDQHAGGVQRAEADQRFLLPAERKRIERLVDLLGGAAGRSRRGGGRSASPPPGCRRVARTPSISSSAGEHSSTSAWPRKATGWACSIHHSCAPFMAAIVADGGNARTRSASPPRAAMSSSRPDVVALLLGDVVAKEGHQPGGHRSPISASSSQRSERPHHQPHRSPRDPCSEAATPRTGRRRRALTRAAPRPRSAPRAPVPAWPSGAGWHSRRHRLAAQIEQLGEPGRLDPVAGAGRVSAACRSSSPSAAAASAPPHGE